ncbi:MAG TPA: winged helix-turn-helix domain-containing protein [Rhabdochlamydiaceae bacterium]|nr:winged helix-turn-helix domain-containing protein [Rhabdochlamydiaceae bacterium]
MLEKLFGNAVIEKILFYLFVNERCYASKLRAIFAIPLYSVQNALSRLEQGGVIVRHAEGKTQIYQFNPRYPFLSELKAFLKKAYAFLPEEYRHQFYEIPIRKRPRRKGKPL